MKKRVGLKSSISTTHVIMLSFLLTILLGSVLLVLPISTVSGVSVPYIDALFTATSATCVTGLVTLTTASTWSVFGQIVILLLIQIGGLGIITIMSALMVFLHRKMRLGERLLVQDAFNLNTLSGLAGFIKKVIAGTFLVEGIGALLYMTVFIPAFGGKGIWISVFTSISAFCNAGIDIIGENSLFEFACNPLINIVTCTLIVLGGIGYIVWWDLVRVFKDARKKGISIFRHLTLHSKIAIVTTLILIFTGGLLFLLFEYNNPATIGSLGFYDKLQVSFFQSITTRTAGFATIDQQSLTAASTALSIFLMFIGGSPVGTAGGIKTVTIAVLAATAFSAIKNRDSTTMFHRNIERSTVRKAIAICGMAFLITFISTLCLAFAMPEASLPELLYEAVSATATVGLSRNLTALLSTAGKLIITATMYLGRIGPISLALALNPKKENPNIIKNPIEEISVG